MSAELRTDIWVAALLRRAQMAGAGAVVARRGDREAGAVLVKVARMDGTGSLFGPALGPDGRRIWLDLTSLAGGPSEPALDTYVARRCSQDDDLWIVEIEDPQGRSFLVDRID